MNRPIRTAGILGSGVMGSAIAAHLAGVGIRVHLLDVATSLSEADVGGADGFRTSGVKDNEAAEAMRSRVAAAGLDRALKHKPALFFDPTGAQLITPGNFEDHLERLAECDLVIEAVVEDLEIKKQLLQSIAPHLNEHAVLGSNTSGLSVQAMHDVLPAKLRSRFLVLHFFNPVRYMRLLEIAPGPSVAPEVVARMVRFGERLGKGVVHAKDTPNFIANRIGVYSMLLTMHQAFAQKLPLEVVDQVTGAPLGRPKSATFGTADLVGIDTLAHVAHHCYVSLPNDEERETFQLPALVKTLLAEGRLGRKSGEGFYKKAGKEIQVLDADTMNYRSQQSVRFESVGAARKAADRRQGIQLLLAGEDEAAKLAWYITSRTLCYAARRVGEIAEDIVNIDRALRWGFNWELGPFELWDAVGVEDSVARMRREGLDVPDWVEQMLAGGRASFYDADPGGSKFYDVQSNSVRTVPEDSRKLSIAAVKAESRNIVAENASASLIDLGDGVLGFEVHTKMNTLDVDVVSLLEQGLGEAEENFEALVIGNDGVHFGAGANLSMFLEAAKSKDWGQIRGVIVALQSVLQRVKYSTIPVVAAPFQYTLGGAAEVAMACDACQAHAETYMGLVEVGVGLVPGGGGCLRMLDRYTADARTIPGVDLLPFVGEASLQIAMAKTSTSAHEAKRLRYLQATDGISMNRDLLLYQAKQRALGLARAAYQPPHPTQLTAVGWDAAKSLHARIWGMVEGGWASEHDALIARKIAEVLCGGQVAAGHPLTEQRVLELELEAFLSLVGEEKTQQRIEHMLQHGRPLRN